MILAVLGLLASSLVCGLSIRNGQGGPRDVDCYSHQARITSPDHNPFAIFVPDHPKGALCQLGETRWGVWRTTTSFLAWEADQGFVIKTQRYAKGKSSVFTSFSKPEVEPVADGEILEGGVRIEGENAYLPDGTRIHGPSRNLYGVDGELLRHIKD